MMNNIEKSITCMITALLMLALVDHCVTFLNVKKISTHYEMASIELEIKKLELKKLQYEVKIIKEQEDLENE